MLESHNSSSTKGDVNDFIDEVNKYNIPIFIIHGKQDLEVKYFLSMSYSFKIQNKCEWNPKNGTHYDIINEYRTKLLIKIKKFLLDHNLLNNVNENFDSLSKINENVDSFKKDEIGERKTANFTIYNENKIINTENTKINIINNCNDDDYYYSHYNSKDIMDANKNQSDCINYNNNIKDYCEIYKSKIKNYDEITINQNDNTTINQNIKDGDDITLNQNIKNNGNININQKKDYDSITINQNIIQYDEDQDLNNIPRLSTVSFIPGDIIPNFKNKNVNQNKNEIYRKPTNKSNRINSFISFNV
jgi:6-pyruvoyl-tetrahydropterin synthase